MRDAETVPVRLSEYRPPDYRIESVDLRFDLQPEATVVRARLAIARRAAAPCPLRLDGRRLELLGLELDGCDITGKPGLEIDDEGLTIAAPPERFTLEIITRIAPAKNTQLEGLYMSAGRFCTQCEPEGFRTITYFLDRPDVLATYRVRIEADRAAYPTLLSNGNPVAAGELGDGRHFTVWDDPHPKPSYLFALVAGAFDSIEDRFKTMTGRDVALAIHVDPGEALRAHYAMDALKRSMKWDEDVFRREYDLDVFNIVAVRDFNFGAMENKGLNIFNAAYVLADPETATDGDYEAIESVVAHEYFHNWTGDRITCRDWFQLCLKEGLTVFRDQEFSADQRSRPVQRIKDVKRLRGRQFTEDAGPLAHPVRPTSYVKIDNFYTATVYEKGAEVIRMLKALIGDDAFGRGMQLYFERRDGTASTVEDFIACFADASGRDLSHFAQWYEQAGTPHLTVRGAYDPAARTYALTVAQQTSPTPGQPHKQPLPIPLQIGFVSADGALLAARLPGAPAARQEHALVLNAAETTFRFEGVPLAPIPALLRGFAAPVVLKDQLSVAERIAQMAHDPDPFTRWEAGQSIARDFVIAHAEGGESPDPAALAEALSRELDRAQEDPAFAALALRQPDLAELIQNAASPDPDRLFAAREALRRVVAERLCDRLAAIARQPSETPFSPDAAAAGRRALKTASLDLLAAIGAHDTIQAAFDAAANMTESIAALDALAIAHAPGFDDALERFYARWRDTPLVIDKWFSVQAGAPRSDSITRAQALRRHPAFELRNPNRVRALAMAFASRNLRAFHAADGSGYRFLAEMVREVDPMNAALSARLLTPFESWRRFDAVRQGHARAELEALASIPSLSQNAREMVERTLA
jgi:aminopeptidase N